MRDSLPQTGGRGAGGLPGTGMGGRGLGGAGAAGRAAGGAAAFVGAGGLTAAGVGAGIGAGLTPAGWFGLAAIGTLALGAAILSQRNNSGSPQALLERSPRSAGGRIVQDATYPFRGGQEAGAQYRLLFGSTFVCSSGTCNPNDGNYEPVTVGGTILTGPISSYSVSYSTGGPANYSSWRVSINGGNPGFTGKPGSPNQFNYIGDRSLYYPTGGNYGVAGRWICTSMTVIGLVKSNGVLGENEGTFPPPTVVAVVNNPITIVIEEESSGTGGDTGFDGRSITAPPPGYWIRRTTSIDYTKGIPLGTGTGTGTGNETKVGGRTGLGSRLSGEPVIAGEQTITGGQGTQFERVRQGIIERTTTGGSSVLSPNLLLTPLTPALALAPPITNRVEINGGQPTPTPTPEEQRTGFPVTQPGTGGCCGSLGAGQQRIEDRLNQLPQQTAQGIDLALLGVINNKLGDQVPGGLSGWLGKFAQSIYMDKAINLASLVFSIHNAFQLSRNLGYTVSQLITEVIQFVGSKMKNEALENFDVAEALGDSIDDAMDAILGKETNEEWKKTMSKYNRIYQATTNLLSSIESMFWSLQNIVQLVGQYQGKVGNALKRSGVVLEDSYNWMQERFGMFTSRRFQAIDKFVQGVQGLEEVTENLSDITGEIREVTEQADELKDQREELTRLIQVEKPDAQTDATKVREQDEDKKAKSASGEVSIAQDGQPDES